MRRVLRKQIVTQAAPLPEPRVMEIVPYQRNHPAQKDDGAMFMYAPSTVSEEHFLWYAYNVWVASAINRIVEAAASANLNVYRRDDPVTKHEHKMLELLGRYGRPNDEEDSFEFFEHHHQNLELTGNSIWYWTSKTGAPEQVYVLDPRHVEIVPGTSRTIAKYVYRSALGKETPIDPASITHFRRANPFSRYWGLSVMEALRLELSSDRHMAKWNDSFFGDNVGVPTGIIFVPPDTPDPDMMRVEDEWNAKYSGRRRTAVMRGTPGAVSYVPAGAVHRDLDFKEGRFLSRQAVYEVLDLPLGLMSEASTEAHARVAERQFLSTIDRRLERTARKITLSVLNMWPGWKSIEARFEDKRRDVDDWQQVSLKVASMMQTHTINEVRAKVYNDPPIPGGEKLGRMQNADDGRDSGDAGRNSETASRPDERTAAGERPGKTAESEPKQSANGAKA